MIAQMDCHGLQVSVDFARGVPISIPLDPHGPQPAFFTVRPANARPLQVGDYIGDMERGGSCNAETVEFTPHCHGTHTECIGHITTDGQTVQDTIYLAPVLARVASLRPGPGPGRHDSPRFSRSALEHALPGLLVPPVEALVIRTIPNDPTRKVRDYMQAPDYPVFGPQAIEWLSSLPLKHLLVDSPSLDEPRDNGRLINHRTWWGLVDQPVPRGIDPAKRSVTEMIYVPDEVEDGLYWLQPGLSPLVGDATPSRPIIYPARPAS